MQQSKPDLSRRQALSKLGFGALAGATTLLATQAAARGGPDPADRARYTVQTQKPRKKQANRKKNRAGKKWWQS